MGAEEPGDQERDKERPCPTPHVGVLLFVLSHTVQNSGAPGRGGGAIAHILGICLLGVRKGGRGTRAREGARVPFPRVAFKGSPALPFPPSPSSPAAVPAF